MKLITLLPIYLLMIVSSVSTNILKTETIDENFTRTPLSDIEPLQKVGTKKRPSPTKENHSNKISRETTVVLNHLYNLETRFLETQLDSRGLNQDLKIGEYDAMTWHKENIKRVKEETEKVRAEVNKMNSKSSYTNQYSPDSTNLVRFQLALLGHKEEEIGIYNDKRLFASGWPAGPKRKVIESIYSKDSLFFLSGLIDNFDSIYKKDPLHACKNLAEQIKTHYSQDIGFLIRERHNYPHALLNKINFEKSTTISQFQSLFLHSEHGLLFYLNQNISQIAENFTHSFSERKDNNTSDLLLCLNIASSRSICLLCSDRLLAESEWGKGFVNQLTKKLKRSLGVSNLKIKLIVMASFFEHHSDTVKDQSLIEKYSKCSLEERSKIGFNLSKGVGYINFFDKDIQKRQPSTTTEPYIHHSKIG